MCPFYEAAIKMKKLNKSSFLFPSSSHVEEDNYDEDKRQYVPEFSFRCSLYCNKCTTYTLISSQAVNSRPRTSTRVQPMTGEKLPARPAQAYLAALPVYWVEGHSDILSCMYWLSEGDVLNVH